MQPLINFVYASSWPSANLRIANDHTYVSSTHQARGNTGVVHQAAYQVCCAWCKNQTFFFFTKVGNDSHELESSIIIVKLLGYFFTLSKAAL